jgi:hypothetical protein
VNAYSCILVALQNCRLVQISSVISSQHSNHLHWAIGALHDITAQFHHLAAVSEQAAAIFFVTGVLGGQCCLLTSMLMTMTTTVMQMPDRWHVALHHCRLAGPS